MKEVVLFVTHHKKQCGVYEFGVDLFNAIANSSKYNFIHESCGSLEELSSAVNRHKPAAIIYNYHPAVMPWLCTKIAKGMYKNHIAKIPILQLGIIHEVTQHVSDNATAYRNALIFGEGHKRLNSLFDFYIAPDPTLLLKNPYVFKTGRLLPDFSANSNHGSSLPVIGSFGFATPNKGFEKLVERVMAEFDEAVIRMNIPNADFGDSDGIQASMLAEKCRQLVLGSKIKLEITHDYLSKNELLDFLAGNDINVFMYQDKQGRGLSSAVDLALAAGKPIALSDCPMFRHILTKVPGCNLQYHSIKEILTKGFEPFQSLKKEWNQTQMIWEFERILKAAFVRKDHKAPLSNGSITGFFESRWNKWLTKPERTFTWLGNTRAATDDDLSFTGNVAYTPVQLNETDNFNRILDDDARKTYEPAVAKLFELAPATMKKKISRANVQQAFIFDTVYRHLNQYTKPRLLCIGSYEDTASMALIKMGYDVVEIDPMINYFLQEYITRPGVALHSFDVIFSTSVIEHDPDDKSFMECIDKLLAPGGLGVITCDYKDGWKPGEPKPDVDARFYTQKDLSERLPAYLTDCTLADQPDWDCPNPDFIYLNKYQYTFATFTFRKNK